MQLDDVERVLASYGPVTARLLPLGELRRRRNELRDLEDQLSYVRRLLHGRIDVATVVLDARTAGTVDADALVGVVLERLNETLIEPAPEAPTRPRPAVIDPDPELGAEVDGLGGGDVLGLVELDDTGLRAVIDVLSAHEDRVSRIRQGLHHVIDAVGVEIAERYLTASVS